MTVSKPDILDTVYEALADNVRDDLNGGVPPDEVAQRYGCAEDTAMDYLNKLVDDGDLVSVDGLGPKGVPRTSFLPADHDDASPSIDTMHP